MTSTQAVRSTVKPYEYVNRVELKLSLEHGSLQAALPKVKDVSVWKRILGCQYKKYVVTGKMTIEQFTKIISILIQHQQPISADNIDYVYDTVSALS